MAKQLIKVAPSSTEVTVEITLPDSVPAVQSGGTPITNQPPIANAGGDQTVTLPTNSTTLIGSGIDPEGQPVSFSWSQVSGPSTAMISEPNKASTIVASLLQGTYVFRLTVTDNKGVTAVDNVSVKVDPEQTPNQPPQVSAGQDLTITLPQNSVVLDGTASDPDGTIVSSLWTKVSGPSASIVNPNAIDTQANNLVQGTYVFQLEATDNDGVKKTDTMTVTVNPASTTPPTTFAIEGFGADVTGGSASTTVYHVINLNSSGTGSLSAGIGSNKTIVFDVSGTITGRIGINNISNLTIDAYSSKQDITINNNNNGDAINIDGSKNILIRGIRVTNAGNDGLNVTGSSNNVVFDHCGSYQNRDGNIDLAATSSAGKNFTVQWCIMGNNIGSGNMLITTQNASVHHNLFVGDGSGEGAERNPYAHSNYSPVGTPPNFDFRNNLLKASGRYVSGNGYGSVGNYVNNYYTSNKAGLINLCADNTSCGRAYVSGNFNQPSATGGTSVSTEYAIPTKYKITTTDAKTAAQAILANVGPYKRNAYEQSVINSITIS